MNTSSIKQAYENLISGSASRDPAHEARYLQDVHALQGDHSELPQPVPGQVHVGHGEQRTGEAPLPQQAESALGLRGPRLGAAVFVTEQLLQGEGLGLPRAPGTGEGRVATRTSGCPPLRSYLPIGGHQDFWLPIQINISDQATEDAVKLVAARQEKLVLQAPVQQVPEGPQRRGRLRSDHSAWPGAPQLPLEGLQALLKPAHPHLQSDHLPIHQGELRSLTQTVHP